MLKDLTEDCFKTVIMLAESDEPDDFFRVISVTSPEDCARLYVASLLFQNKAFPEKIRVSRYSTLLNDKGMFFEFYKIASCHGIGISEVESLYNRSELPEMIWTEAEGGSEQVESGNLKLVKEEGNTLVSPLYASLEKIGVDPVFTLLKPGACPYSSQTKALRKKGAKIQSYKVVYDGRSIIVNEVDYNGSLSYDINMFHCKDEEEFRKEFKRKFMRG